MTTKANSGDCIEFAAPWHTYTAKQGETPYMTISRLFNAASTLDELKQAAKDAKPAINAAKRGNVGTYKWARESYTYHANRIRGKYGKGN